MNKQALYALSYGVYLCTSWDEGRPVGCVANSAMQITSSPATVAVRPALTCAICGRD